MAKIAKVKLESLKFSEARMRSNVYRLSEKQDEIIDWINEEEKRRERVRARRT